MVLCISFSCAVGVSTSAVRLSSVCRKWMAAPTSLTGPQVFDCASLNGEWSDGRG